MEEWAAFGGDLAAASSALVGLLFVAVSVQRERFRTSRALLARAGQALVLFSAALMAGTLLSTPTQTASAVGVELLALAVLLGAILYRFQRRAEGAQATDTDSDLSAGLGRIAPSAGATILFALAGIAAYAVGPSGLILVLPATLVALGGGIVLSWLLLIR
jgi:hypothetical protein